MPNEAFLAHLSLRVLQSILSAVISSKPVLRHRQVLPFCRARLTRPTKFAARKKAPPFDPKGGAGMAKQQNLFNHVPDILHVVARHIAGLFILRIQINRFAFIGELLAAIVAGHGGEITALIAGRGNRRP